MNSRGLEGRAMLLHSRTSRIKSMGRMSRRRIPGHGISTIRAIADDVSPHPCSWRSLGSMWRRRIPDARKISSGKFNGVLHYNAKNEINAISAKEHPELWKKTTNVWVGVGEDGKVTGYVQPMPYTPNTKISTAWPGDLGAVFFAIAQGGEEFCGKTIAVVGESARGDDRLATWAKGRLSEPLTQITSPSNVDAHSPSAWSLRLFEQVTAEAILRACDGIGRNAATDCAERDRAVAIDRAWRIHLR